MCRGTAPAFCLWVSAHSQLSILGSALGLRLRPRTRRGSSPRAGHCVNSWDMDKNPAQIGSSWCETTVGGELLVPRLVRERLLGGGAACRAGGKCGSADVAGAKALGPGALGVISLFCFLCLLFALLIQSSSVGCDQGGSPRLDDFPAWFSQASLPSSSGS